MKKNFIVTYSFQNGYILAQIIIPETLILKFLSWFELIVCKDCMIYLFQKPLCGIFKCWCEFFFLDSISNNFTKQVNPQENFVLQSLIHSVAKGLYTIQTINQNSVEGMGLWITNWVTKKWFFV